MYRQKDLLHTFCALLVCLHVAATGFREPRDRAGACTRTATAAYRSGIKEAWSDYWLALGNCFNLSDPEARGDCMVAAMEELREALELAAEQREARCDICEALGEAPYDPALDPDDFVDFEAVIEGEEDLTPNRFFPLVPGTTWEYLAVDADGELMERILVEVLEETKEILDINCIVVRDRVWEIDEEGEEELVEDTRDWYAQDLEGSVWYLGEIAVNYEDGELADLEGSWQAGKDYAKAGYLMLADPAEGDYYRQEFLLGEAEDMGEVISRGEETVEVPYGVYDTDVLQTRDWTPIEPDVFEFKFYAPGIGCILELNPDTGERVELVSMTGP